jgi:cysteine desulfurase/selenocysteine lyase
MTEPDSPPWSAFRAEMPVVERWAYFDHAAVAPLSGRAKRAIDAWGVEYSENGDANSTRFTREVERTRKLGAKLLNAAAEEIALVPNTTAGVNLVAEGYPWRAGDNVVFPANEFPANQYPWMNLASRGVEARRVEMVDGRIDWSRMAEACDARTRIISVSWVGYASGYRIDLDEAAQFARERGAHLFVDAIQGLGVFPIDVQRTPIDFLAADGHKWLLGPEGAGLFYLRREHLGLLRPTGVGWHSVAHSSDYARIELSLRQNAARFEGGTWNMPGILGLGGSLELLLEHGAEALSVRVLEVTNDLCARLQERGATIASVRESKHASGIVSFDLSGINEATVRRLCLERGVVLNNRAGHVRVSAHAYNDTADLDRLFAALDEIRGSSV